MTMADEENNEKKVLAYLNKQPTLPTMPQNIEQLKKGITAADLTHYKRMLFNEVLKSTDRLPEYDRWVLYYRGHCEAILMALGWSYQRMDIVEGWINEAKALKA
jgi:hypothetical protein